MGRRRVRLLLSSSGGLRMTLLSGFLGIGMYELFEEL